MNALSHRPNRQPRSGSLGSRVALFLATLLMGLTLLLPAASAESLAEMKDKVQQYTLKLADLEKEDVEKGAIKELKLTQLWLNEAQAQLVREEEDLAGKNLRRVGIAVEMIAALIENAKAERAALDRESAAISMKQKMQDAKIALEQAQAEKRRLISETTETGDKGGS